MCYVKLTCAMLCVGVSSICSDSHVRWMQIRGNAILCYVAVWIHCFFGIAVAIVPAYPSVNSSPQCVYFKLVELTLVVSVQRGRGTQDWFQFTSNT